MSGWRENGYIESVVGGLAGGVLGFFSGIAISRATAVGDLSDIGTGLMWVFFMTSVGLAMGAFIALRLGKRRNAGRTALLVLPAMFLGVFVLTATLRVADSVPGLGWVAVIAIPILALIVARRFSLID